MRYHFRALLPWFVALLFIGHIGADPASAGESAFFHDGFVGLHPMNTGPTNDHIDPLSGNLQIVTTDLVLPGNAGFSLPITRWYSSQIDYWDGGYIEDTFVGVGWQLHFGRVVHLESVTPGVTVIELPLGGGGPLYRTSKYPEGWMTKSFARYNRSTHTLQLPNGQIYKFGYEPSTLHPQYGKVRYTTEITDSFGNRVTFEYHGGGSSQVIGVKRIVQYISGTQVREVNFTIGTTLKDLQTMTFNGRTWTYEQTQVGTGPLTHLRKVRYPGNASTNPDWEYSYCCFIGEITSLRYPNGGKVNYAYQEITRVANTLSEKRRVITGRVTTGSNITTRDWHFTYGQGTTGDWTYVTPVTGSTTVLKYRFWGIGTGSDYSAYIKGAVREIRAETTSGSLLERTTMTYLKSEMISSDPIPKPWGDSAVFNALLETKTVTRASQSFKTTYTYRWGQGNFNEFGNPIEILEEGESGRSRTTTLSYRPPSAFTRHFLGKLAGRTVTVGSESSTSSWTYDTAGFVLTANINGVGTTYTRFADGNVATSTDARGNQTSFQYSWGMPSRIETPELLTTRTINANGQITAETVGSLTTTYTYDAMGRVTKIRPPGAGTLTVETVIAYTGDSWSRQIKITRGSLDSEIWLDEFGRERVTIGPGGVRRSIKRDGDGRVTFRSYPHTSTTSVPGTTITYDGLGRPLTSTESDGSVTRHTYSGANNVTVTDAENRATSYIYTAIGHPDGGMPTSVTDAAGTVTTYEYNAFDTLTKVTVPGVPARIWMYDSRNCLTSETHPESGTTTYELDPLCNPTQITDAAGQTFTLTYDGNNRLVERNAPGTASDLTITYDSSGRVTAQEIPNSRTTYAYDGAGRLASRTDTYNGNTWQSAYAYDTLDRLTSLTYPSGRVVGYSYDSGGRLGGVTQQGQVFADAFSYNGAGQLEAFRTGSVVQTLSYDSRLRVRRLTAGAALDLTYTYDRTSNLLGFADARPGQDQTFEYDALTRLTDASGPWGQLSWTYDAAGNRLTESGPGGSMTYSYSASTQRLLSTSGASSESFSYDALGRLTADGRGTYTYTATSKLATSTTPAGAATHAYTADDFRVATVVSGGSATYTIRGAEQQVLSEYQSAAWTRDLIYADGRLLGSVSNGSIEFYAIDSLGSTRAVFDGEGALLGQSDYLPFGQALNASGTLPAQRFTGQERDEEDGLDYFNARMYQPRTGRFNTVDPMFAGSDSQGWNRYAYALNNPVTLIDPSGMCIAGPGSHYAGESFALVSCPTPAGPVGIHGWIYTAYGPRETQWYYDSPANTGSTSGGAGVSQEPSGSSTTSEPEVPSLTNGNPAQKKKFDETAREAAKRVSNRTRSKCGELFGGSKAALDAMNSARWVVAPMPQGNRGADAAVNRFTNPTTIMLNPNGKFFQPQFPMTANGLTPPLQAQLILLHETAHLVGVFGPDANDASLQRRENNIIISSCLR